MADNPNETGMKAFLEMAGRSLSGAQGELGAGINLQSNFVLANAELEARIGLKQNGNGEINVEPISSADMVKSNINSAAISTLRINFVAAAAESTPGEAANTPKRTKKEVADEVLERPDVKRLAEILGPLKVIPTYEPTNKRWVVVAEDQRGRIIREALIADE